MLQEGFASWVKVIEASANGDTRAYSDDSDGYNDGRHYGNLGGAGWDHPHRSHIGGGEGSRPRAGDYYDDEMSEDQRRGDVQRSRYAGDDLRLQHPEDDRNWDHEQGQCPVRPRSRPPDDAAYGRARELHNGNFGEPSRRAPHDEPPLRGPQPYREGEETQEYQRSKMQDVQANRLSQQRPYTSDKGPPPFPKLQVRTSRVGNNDTIIKEENTWGQKQFKNVNIRRRSVPLQCLDSALDEMTTSIGNMGPLQGISPPSYSSNMDETATNYSLQSSKPEVPSEYSTQSSAGFNNRTPLAAEVQSQGNDSSSSYISQSSYSTGPKQVQLQGIDSSSSYINQSSYSTGPKQVQSQQGIDSLPPYINKSSYLTGPKQMQTQGNNSSSSYIHQSGYTTGPKQIQGNNLSSSVPASPSQYDPNMNTYDYRMKPWYNTNMAIDSNKSDAGGYNPGPSPSQQSAALGKSTVAAGVVDWGGGRPNPRIDAHKKAPMMRSDTKAYGAIMGGASSAAPPQFGSNTRMPLGGNSKPQPPTSQDLGGARPFQG